MGSATVAITTTTTTPAITATTTSRTGTGGTGSGTAPSGSAMNPDAQDIRDAFGAALHRTGPGALSGGGPRGPGGSRGPGGPGGGLPLPVPIAHLVPIPANPDVHVMGSPPRIFDRDRQQADVFINELLTYICINFGVLGFESPMRKIAMVLTYIKGDKVDHWVERIAEWWDTLNPTIHNVHYTWTLFLGAFWEHFLDHTKQQRAGIKIKTLKLHFPTINKYISEFEDLATLVGYTIGSAETINLFLKGLTTSANVFEKVMDHPTPNNYYNLKNKAISIIKSRQLVNTLKHNATPGQFRSNSAFRQTY